jgi:hypothetical protein
MLQFSSELNCCVFVTSQFIYHWALWVSKDEKMVTYAVPYCIAVSLECQLANIMPESSHWFWNMTETLDADFV